MRWLKYSKSWRRIPSNSWNVRPNDFYHNLNRITNNSFESKSKLTQIQICIIIISYTEIEKGGNLRHFREDRKMVAGWLCVCMWERREIEREKAFHMNQTLPMVLPWVSRVSSIQFTVKNSLGGSNPTRPNEFRYSDPINPSDGLRNTLYILCSLFLNFYHKHIILPSFYLTFSYLI